MVRLGLIRSAGRTPGRSNERVELDDHIGAFEHIGEILSDSAALKLRPLTDDTRA